MRPSQGVLNLKVDPKMIVENSAVQEQCRLEQGSAYYRKTTQYTYSSSLHDASKKGSLKYCLQNKSQHDANY